MPLSNEMRKDLSDIHDSHRRMVQGVCRSFLKKLPREDLDDLTQYAWERICVYYDKYAEERSSISTWITLICRSVMYDLIRKHNAEKRGAGVPDESLSNYESIIG